MAQCRDNDEVTTETNNGIDISDLPNDVLEHILSFLSSREAVRTCVLSKNWQNLWKFVPALCIRGTVEDCSKFLRNFLLARNHAPINVCDIEFTGPESVEMHDIDTWIFHVATACQVRELNLVIWFEDDFLYLRNQALFSKHLRRLHLDKVELQFRTVDFSCCPALEDLELEYCNINAKHVTSRSLKRLTAKQCNFNGMSSRTRISVPSLVLLKLIDNWTSTPLLEPMPSLEDAYVRFGNFCWDYCQYSDTGGCDNEDCIHCSSIEDDDDDKEHSLLLEGLSTATHLELINEPGMFIFKRDLRQCPSFRNLKTLILNEWIVDTDLQGLRCILHNSPVLEELNLILFEAVEFQSNGGHDRMENLLVLEHIKKVNVKCQKLKQWVITIINTLISFGISHEKIVAEEI